MLAFKNSIALVCLFAASLTEAITLGADDECCTPTCCASTCCDDEPDEPGPERDDEDPSEFCCFFYKNSNFMIEDPDDKLILCAMSTNYGLVPNAVGLPEIGEYMHFDNEMESYKCGLMVEAHVCGGVFSKELITDAATGMQSMNYLCNEETLDMIERGEQASHITYGDTMSGVIVNPILLM